MAKTELGSKVKELGLKQAKLPGMQKWAQPYKQWSPEVKARIALKAAQPAKISVPKVKVPKTGLASGEKLFKI